MRLVSQKEYDNLKREEIKPLPVQIEQKKIKPKFEYVFMHPDMIHNYQSGIYRIKVNDMIRELKIEAGCVKTKDEDEYKILKNEGLIFLRSNEVKYE